MSASRTSDRFRRHVTIPFQLYAGLIQRLPFPAVERSGAQLSLFGAECRSGLDAGRSPRELVDGFFERVSPGASTLDTLFLFLQQLERQILLFDAVEDSAFAQLREGDGVGSIAQLAERVGRRGRRKALAQLLPLTATRIVLTAHPTQFYPDAVQRLLIDLRDAVGRGDVAQVEEFLMQLGKTRFQNRLKPTPIDEVKSLLFYLEEVFYELLPRVQGSLIAAARGSRWMDEPLPARPNLEIGFWPGGDRDGNPFVTAESTRETVALLRERVLACHLRSLRRLQRRLTFDGVSEELVRIEGRLRATWLGTAARAWTYAGRDGGATVPSPSMPPEGQVPYGSAEELLGELATLRANLRRDHQSLFVSLVDEFILAVWVFRFHFASVDIRQNSAVFAATLAALVDRSEGSQSYLALSKEERFARCRQLLAAPPTVDAPLGDELLQDTLDTLRAVGDAQNVGGSWSVHRVIASHAGDPHDVLEILVLLMTVLGAEGAKGVDVVPLFESIDDLNRAEGTMRALFDCEEYRRHLEARGNQQTVMVGFSDGTKDGGYLAANWAIRQAKRRLTALARSRGLRIVFFDGRGGPPARGGGNTHAFYRSADGSIDQWETQLTIQGQTVGSNFGSLAAAKFNVEQLVTANLENLVFPEEADVVTANKLALLDELAARSQAAYVALRDDPDFLPYLEEATPLPLFRYLTVGSRPVARQSGALTLDSLRAIPFVGAWSSQKQIIPGFYGLGTALEPVVGGPGGEALVLLYQRSLFVRTLVDNAMMSLKKSDSRYTAHLADHPRFGRIWRRIQEERDRTERCLLAISGQTTLLANDELNAASIELREESLAPVVVILQYALEKLRELEGETAEVLGYRRLALKALAAIINGSRNAA